MKIYRIPCLKHALACAVISLAIPSLLSAKPSSQENIRNTSNQIDQYIASYLNEKNIKANPLIDDATFLRRSYISIGGRIPTPDEAEQFLDDPAADKRKSLVDTLINSSGYKSKMFNFWADLLRLQTNQEQFGLGWHNWIRNAVDSNMPYDKFVNSMLAAEGLASENPAVGYYLRDRNMLLDNVSNSAQIFLGTQIGCAQCHDHPFDDLTQKQYYEFAAFIGDTTYQSEAAQKMIMRMTHHTMDKKDLKQPSLEGLKDKKKGAKLNEHKKIVQKLNRNYNSIFRNIKNNATSSAPSKYLRLPKDYKYNDGKPGDIVTPQTFLGEPIHLTEGTNHQQAFADWITSPKNPRFTQVIVNRLWAEVFGRGIVASLDNWSETTRISHPELLDYLCEVMKALDYDVQQFMRVLYHTRLFESSAAMDAPKLSGSYDFRGPVLRRMSAEELHDSFIVLKFGNMDETKNDTIKTKWDQHTQNMDKLFNMPIPELIAFDKAADEHDQKLTTLRAKARKLKIQISKAEGLGDKETVQKLKKQLHNQYKINNKASMEKKDDGLLALVLRRNLRINKSSPALRASEKPSPAKPGTFIRDFGGSDREITDASHTHASIPQALTLLNGKEIDTLTNKQSQLAKGIIRTKNPSARLEHLFLSIYGQRPSDSERDQYESMMDQPDQTKALAKAMLNSKRFIFVQ